MYEQDLLVFKEYVKWQGHATKYSTPLCSKVKNVWSSIPSYILWV